jgi:Holliday junction resolvase
MRAERQLVHLLQTAGFAAERVPLSGAARGRFCGDVSVPLLGRDLRCEVKARACGFAQLYTWLADHDVLVVKADRRRPLLIVPLRLAIEVATLAERAKMSDSFLSPSAPSKSIWVDPPQTKPANAVSSKQNIYQQTASKRSKRT